MDQIDALAKRPSTPIHSLEELGPPHTHAERRQLTILFCDIVGSTAISERLDPEDLREVMFAYEAVCRREIALLDGAIIRVVGDGILFGFGHPRSYEDGAERAVKAGLSLIRALHQMPAVRGVSLNVRIGISTGLVVASELVAGRVSEVTGITPIAAVRMQGLAPPNGIVIADSTRRLVGDMFALADLGSQKLKGFAEPLQAWQVLGPGDLNSRSEAVFLSRSRTPLVGRQSELNLIVDRCERAAGREGQVVRVSGEAGIGKSRLVAAVRDALPRDRYHFIYCYSSPHHGNTALYPFVVLFERTYQLSRDDPPRRLQEAAQAMVDSAGLPEAPAKMLAKLIGVAGVRTESWSAQRERELTFEAVLQQLLAMVGNQPTVVVLEDAHWADPTTLEFLNYLATRIEKESIALIVTSRPGTELSFDGGRQGLKLALERLSFAESAQMVGTILPDHKLAARVVDAITAKSDGVPLFLEELTKSLLDSRLIRLVGSEYVLVDELSAMAVPTTLQDLLMTRLDRLETGREVAQIAAVIGREFRCDLLSTISDLHPEVVQSALRHLVAAGILFQQGTSPDASFAFKHVLLQEAAASSLLRKRRRALHTAIVEALEEPRLGQLNDADLELLAYHSREAGLIERAVSYSTLAGERASAKSASAEAIGHLRRAETLVTTLGDDQKAQTMRLRVFVALGPALITQRGGGTAEVDQTYKQALDLCATLPESELHFAANWGRWLISVGKPNWRGQAAALEALAERLDNPEFLLQAHHCQWATLFNLGDHVACCEHIDAGLAVYDPVKHMHHSAIYGGHDPKVCGLGERALALWILGYADQALASARDGLASAEALEHAGSLAHSLDQSVMLHRYRRDAVAVLRDGMRLRDFAEEQAMRDHRIKGDLFVGWAQAVTDFPDDGTRAMEAAVATQLDIGTTEDYPVYFDMLAEGRARLGRFHDALEAIDRGLAESQSGGPTYWTAELYRRRAELMWRAQRPHDQILESLDAAFAVCREQCARALELRTAMTALQIARQGLERDKALDELDRIHAWFQEGFGEPDLILAQQLLQGAPS